MGLVGTENGHAGSQRTDHVWLVLLQYQVLTLPMLLRSIADDYGPLAGYYPSSKQQH
jgi:hypothetical protein